MMMNCGAMNATTPSSASWSASHGSKIPMLLPRAICSTHRMCCGSGVHVDACVSTNVSRNAKDSMIWSGTSPSLYSKQPINKFLLPLRASVASTSQDVTIASLIGREKIGVLLLNLGGPETLEDVQPFLFNLFADPDIIRLPRLFRFLQKPLAQFISVTRAPKSKEGYASIGGGSPLRHITDAQDQNTVADGKPVPCYETHTHPMSILLGIGLFILPGVFCFNCYFLSIVFFQAEELRKSLWEKQVPARVYVGMRYWHPFTEEAIQQIKRDRITKLVVLPLYPQFSISTSGSSLRLLERIFREDEYLVSMQHTVIPSWYQREGYIKALANLIGKELETFDHPEQSRVGPVEWLKPYTDETIIELGKRGVKCLLAVPISFVSEHIETLEEIDVEYKELALKSGIEKWGRVPALGCEPTFISDLADAVIESLPYVGAMAVSNIEARQSLVPLGSVGGLLAVYDSRRRELQSPVMVWEWGWTRSAETWNGRAAMLAVLVLLVLEVTTGQGFLHQWGILLFFH
ncbi:PREDICTED: ferrochelatase-2, chloroplastic-like isoform X3 [Populus euphratica]|uniref:Ferrochelatase-2, chloroplastic-like isoform X3 n=1 Tax=Populus euphratica TaxID=75702 RepID=A0AAJ6TIW3_POPEU|nr:PREDICTED: ferrochelatase-2, chloroplastic-like isoform X3 [Populus euphratica]